MRGPTYTDEEKTLLSALAKDDTLTLPQRVERFFEKIPSDRSPDAVSQKLRKMRADVEAMRASKKVARKKAPAAAKSAKPAPEPAAVAAPPAKRPSVRRGAPPRVAASTHGHTNGNGNGHTNGHKIAVGEASVQLGAVKLSGPAAEVGKMLQQLAS